MDGGTFSAATICVRHTSGGKVKTEVRTFATMAGALLDLSAWLAEDDFGLMCLGSGAYQGELLPGPVPPPALTALFEESYLRRSRLATDDRLSHAQEWNLLPGPRSKPLQSARQSKTYQAAGRPYGKPRLRGQILP